MTFARIALLGVVLCFGTVTAVPAVTIEVGTVSGAAGSTVAVPTTLKTMGGSVRAVINELRVDARSPIASCTVNPIFGVTGVVELYPEDCQAGVSCVSARAVLAQFSNALIPDGTTLYSCDLEVAGDASGALAIACSDPQASGPNGETLEVSCTNGAINVTTGGPTCAGDCNSDGEVFGNEVTVAINVVAGNADLSSCQNADANGDGEVFGNEVTIAINNVANGCPQ